jgi:hypothetical protein
VLRREESTVEERKNKLFQSEPLLLRSMANRFQKCVSLMLLYTVSAAKRFGVVKPHSEKWWFDCLMRVPVRLSDGS